MRLFRRRETLNARLIREAGLEPPGTEPAAVSDEPYDPFAAFRRRLDPESNAVMFRAREFDAIVTAEAPGVRGDEVRFATLPDGTIIVDEGSGDANLSPLADAVEEQLAPPYRARAVRRSERIWAVSANRLEVLRMKAPGDRVELAVHDGERTLTVDGERSTRRIAELERLGETNGRDYAAHAERLEGDLWEVRVSPL